MKRKGKDKNIIEKFRAPICESVNLDDIKERRKIIDDVISRI